MSSALIGTWSLETSENLNEYLRQLGMALVKRKVTITIKPTLIIAKNDDDLWSITIDMKSKGTETIFTENNEIDTSNELKFVFDQRFYFDSRRNCKSIFKFENPNKLVQIMKFIDTEEHQTIIRELNEDGYLIENLEMNGIKATRVYKRA